MIHGYTPEKWGNDVHHIMAWRQIFLIQTIPSQFGQVYNLPKLQIYFEAAKDVERRKGKCLKAKRYCWKCKVKLP